MIPRNAACLILAVALLGVLSPTAQAQDAAAPQRSVVTLPLQDLPPADTLACLSPAA